MPPLIHPPVPVVLSAFINVLVCLFIRLSFSFCGDQEQNSAFLRWHWREDSAELITGQKEAKRLWMEEEMGFILLKQVFCHEQLAFYFFLECFQIKQRVRMLTRSLHSHRRETKWPTAGVVCDPGHVLKHPSSSPAPSFHFLCRSFHFLLAFPARLRPLGPPVCGGINQTINAPPIYIGNVICGK